MSEQQAYPYRRVIIGFTLCPAMVSATMLVGLFEHIFLHPSPLHPWWVYLVVMLPVAGVALVFYGVPALLLALLYAAVRPYKSLSAYILVFLAGGLGAHLWGPLVNYLNPGQTFLTFPGLGPYGPFLLGATTSLVMAYLVLPKRNP